MIKAQLSCRLLRLPEAERIMTAPVSAAALR
jgi:hypothetical protein